MMFWDDLHVFDLVLPWMRSELFFSLPESSLKTVPYID